MRRRNHSFLPLPSDTWHSRWAAVAARSPVIYRGAAAHWPSVRRWSFDRLAAQVQDQPVQLVRGNREQGQTQFETTPLRAYLAGLGNAQDGAPAGYLKEFDLLKTAPALRADLHFGALIPRWHLRATSCWIGPAGARTGLHFDHLDNLSVQVLGSKRWRFVRPGVVERQGLVSSKYDHWAVLGRGEAADLLDAAVQGDCFEVDLHPGDLLWVPAGWWHEVRNLSPSLFVGGFHGAVLPVLTRWGQVCARSALHRFGWIGRSGCTCHPARDTY